MKGSAKVIEVLNDVLAAEITAINQYFVHAKMCENWGYQLLYEDTEERAVEEMKHAEKLIERILYLEGIPIVTKIEKINIGSTVEAQANNDHGLEKIAIQRFNSAIKLCNDESDAGSRELLEHILLDEEKHADDLEAYLQEIKDMGIQNFLATQVHKKEKS
ncbi:MAG: bacterioferritin [Candidatus Brocadia sp.]|nr:bacterioferritin [Candidatus Brocadia sp.]